MKVCYAILVLLLIHSKSFSQHVQWGSLKPGKYEVGYRTFLWYDSSRQYNGGPRPMQVFVWYPAAAPGDRMKFEGYFADIANDWGLKKESAEYLQKYYRDGFVTSAMNPSFPGKLSPEEFKKLLNTETAVVRNARPASGKFPVIVHRHVTAALHQSVAMEFLASNGYTVASISAYNTSIAYYGRGQDGPAGLMSATEDLSFIVSKLRHVPFADIDRVAMLGMMSDAGISLQMKQPTFKSIACLDCIGYDETLKSLPHFDIAKLRIPLLEAINSDFEDPITNATHSYLDTMKYSDRWFIRSKDLHHTDFYPYPKLLQRDGNKVTNYDHLMGITLNFFNATLINGMTVDVSKLNAGLPRDFFSYRHGEAVVAPPSKEELLTSLRYGPLDNAKRWMHQFPELRQHQPEMFFFTILMVRADDPLAVDASKFYLQYFRDPQHLGMITGSFRNNGRITEADAVNKFWEELKKK